MNPNPKMTPLSSGDRYTLTVEVHKELFDLFCEVGRDGRAGMIIDGMLMVSERPRPVGYEDEGEPAIEKEEANKTKLKGGELSKLAGRWCKNQEFIDWLSYHTHFEPSVHSDAASFIRGECRIKSRAELDHNDVAAETFNTCFRRPYSQYLGKEN